jgi:hypothetical protein
MQHHISGVVEFYTSDTELYSMLDKNGNLFLISNFIGLMSIFIDAPMLTFQTLLQNHHLFFVTHSLIKADILVELMKAGKVSRLSMLLNSYTFIHNIPAVDMDTTLIYALDNNISRALDLYLNPLVFKKLSPRGTGRVIVWAREAKKTPLVYPLIDQLGKDYLDGILKQFLEFNDVKNAKALASFPYFMKRVHPDVAKKMPRTFWII